jgi:hypothetical protein
MPQNPSLGAPIVIHVPLHPFLPFTAITIAMGGYISHPGALAPLPSPAAALWLPTYHAKPKKRRRGRIRRERSRIP